MPTRKSTDATDTDGPSPQPQAQPQTSPVQNVQATEQQLKARAEGVSIEDYLLPRSLTLRLAKSVLPPNTAIQKDAVLAIQKAATVFVSYLASHANEATLKRTVTPADVFAALSELEFEGFVPRLEKELEAFSEMKAGKRKGKKTGAGADAEAGAGQEGGKDEEGSGVREAKRVKRVEGESVPQGPGEEEEDDDDTQEEQEQGVENEEEIEEDEEDEDEDEDDEEDEDETQEEDIDRVEDLDRDSRPRRTMDPDAADDTESEDESGPGTQLQSGLGLG